MVSDDVQIMQALSAAEDRLSKEDSDVLLEFLVHLRSGRDLSGTQRKRLYEIVQKVTGRVSNVG